MAETYVNPFQAATGAAASDPTGSPWGSDSSPNKGSSSLDRNMEKLVDSVNKSVTTSEKLDRTFVSKFEEFGKAIKTRFNSMDDVVDKKLEKLVGNIKSIFSKVSESKIGGEGASKIEGDKRVSILLDNIAKHLEPISKNFEKFVEKMQSNVVELSKLEARKDKTDKTPAEKISDKFEEEKKRFTALKEGNVITNFKGQMDEKVDKMILGLTGKLSSSIGGLAGKMGMGGVESGLKGVSEMAKSRKSLIEMAQEHRAEIIKSTGIQKAETPVADMEAVETPVKAAKATVEKTPEKPAIVKPMVEKPATTEVESSTKEKTASAEEDIFAGLSDDIFELGEKIDTMGTAEKPMLTEPVSKEVEPSKIEAVVEKPAPIEVKPSTVESDGVKTVIKDEKGFVERAIEAMRIFTGELSKIKGDVTPNIKRITEIVSGKTSEDIKPVETGKTEIGSVQPVVPKIEGEKIEPSKVEAVKTTDTEEGRIAQSLDKTSDVESTVATTLDKMVDGQKSEMVSEEGFREKTKKFHEDSMKINKEIAASLVLSNKHLNMIDDTLWDNEEEAKHRHKDDVKKKEDDIKVVTKESKVPEVGDKEGSSGDSGGGMGGVISDFIQDKITGKLGRGLGKAGRAISKTGGRLLGKAGGLARGTAGKLGRVGGQVLGKAGGQVLGRAAGLLGPAAAVAATAYGGYQTGKYIGGKLEEMKPGDLQGKDAWQRASAGDLMVGASPIGQLGRATGLMATNEDIFKKQKADKEEAERLKMQLKDTSKAEVGSETRVDAKKVLQRHQLYEKLSVTKPDEQKRLDAMSDEDFNKEIKDKYGSKWFGRGSAAMTELSAYNKNIDAAKKKEADLVANPPGKETVVEGKLEGVEKTPKPVPTESVPSVAAEASTEGNAKEMGKVGSHLQDLKKLQQEHMDVLKQVGENMKKASEREPVHVTTNMDSSYRVNYNQAPYDMSTNIGRP